MELNESVLNYDRRLLGSDSFSLIAGERIGIRKKINGEWTDILNEKVPNNKTWNVSVYIKIEEDSV